MSSPAALIARIDSILTSSEFELTDYRLYKKRLKLRIGFRTLKMLLVLCFREVDGDGAHLVKRYLSQTSLFSRIDQVIIRLLGLEKIDSEIVYEVYSLLRELHDELSERMSPTTSTLTLDQVSWIAGSILENAAELLTQIPEKGFEEMHAFEVHTRFLTNVLPFVQRTGELQLLLFHIQATVLNAACAFIKYGNDTERYKLIEPECSIVNRIAADPYLYRAYAQALTSSKLLFSGSEDGPFGDQIVMNFLSSLISLLWDVLRHSDSDSRSKHQLIVLYERLRLSRAILKNHKDEKIMGEIGVLVCDAGVLICSLHQLDTGEILSELLQRFGVFLARVELETNPSKASEELGLGEFTQIKISDGGSELQLLENGTPILSHQPSLSSASQVVGFQDDELTSVLDRLTRGSKQLCIVPICGMGGLGKTTFALELYNHSSVKYHFRARAQCSISQVMDKKKVLLHLLNQIQFQGEYSETSGYDLADKLRRSLKGKRYLIVLDDVWTPQIWEDLKASFPDDSRGNRIIMTSRSLDISPQPHLLRLRDDSECLKILEVKLLHTKGWDPELGMKIAKVCKGLPLTAVIVAGLLATIEQQRWKGILDHLSLSCVSGAESALELSYKNLPDYLHQCFLYLGAFPEDEEISVKHLIRLWMAEGFVQEREFKRNEDVAREYVEELIKRSLVMVSKVRSIGGVSTCRMHDLLRDFCLVKSKQENLFHMLEQRRDELSDFNGPCNLQRLVVHSDLTHFKESRLYCPSAQSILLFCSSIQSPVFEISFITHIYHFLKVLEIRQNCLAGWIPSEIQLLTRLRFLSITIDVSAIEIPSSIGMLYNLETLIVYSRLRGHYSFSHTFWNLKNLRHLCVKHYYSFGFTLPTENGETLSSLMELEGIVFCSDDGSMVKQLRKFPNIHKLRCKIVKSSMKESHEIVIPEFLSQLDSLIIRGDGKLKCEFGSTDRVRKLRLDGIEYTKELIAVVGKLPNLEVLKLDYMYYPGGTLEMEEEGFPKLRMLEIGDADRDLERWTACDDQLPCLEKLVFMGCEALEELPLCLENISTLVEIEVKYCSSTLESLVRDIKEVYNDFGNSVIVRIIN